MAGPQRHGPARVEAVRADVSARITSRNPNPALPPAAVCWSLVGAVRVRSRLVGGPWWSKTGRPDGPRPIGLQPPSITRLVERFKRTRSLSVLFQLAVQIVRQGRATELAYGGFCALFHHPSAIHRWGDTGALTRISGEKGEYLRRAVLSRSQLIQTFNDRFAVDTLPSDFEAARRESVRVDGKCLILGEYGEGARIACVTAKSCVLSEYYGEIRGVRHIHAIHPYGHAGEYLVSTGDRKKLLDLWVINEDELRFERRLRSHLAGYTAVAEVNGRYYFGTDFSGRPNYIEVLGGGRYFFPQQAYRLHAATFHVVLDRYIVSVNKELEPSGGRRTLSVFDTHSMQFVYCDSLEASEATSLVETARAS
jgi:hypothetical protein